MKLKSNLKNILTCGLFLGLAGTFGCKGLIPEIEKKIVEGEVISEDLRNGLFTDSYVFLLKNNNVIDKYEVHAKIGQDPKEFDFLIDKGDMIELEVIKYKSNNSDGPIFPQYKILKVNGCKINF